MIETQKDLRGLPVLSGTGSRSSVLTVSGAKWKKVSISGWRYEVNQNAALAICLTPSGDTSGGQLSGFENPIDEGGGFDLEIHFDEPVDVSGDQTTLLAASRACGQSYAVLLECVPGCAPPISKCFKLQSSGDQLKPVRLRVTDEQDSPHGLAKALPFLRSASKAGHEISANDGSTVPIPAGSILTAIDDADVGVPITAVTGAKNIGAVIGCQFDAVLWTYEGKGHPSLGVLIWVGIPAGKSVRFSKPVVAVVAHPAQRSSRRMSISLTDSVEERRGTPPIRY
jgi:hypothetical protein